MNVSVVESQHFNVYNGQTSWILLLVQSRTAFRRRVLGGIRCSGLQESQHLLLGEVVMDDAARSELIELTADIVSAYVSNNTVASSELPTIIGDIYLALSRARDNGNGAEREELRPAVAVKNSVKPDYIICLEDGKKFKSLKRHLRTHYNLSPEEYREKWGLPHDYPMVAPNYAAARSELAKKMGLGTRRDR
jgi:predicted transcriptional regulator